MHSPCDKQDFNSIAHLALSVGDPSESGGSGTLDALSPWCSVLFVQFEHIGCLPVLIDDGRINTDVLRFLRFQKERGRAPFTLNRSAIGLSKFSDFIRWASARPSERPIIKAFFQALIHGNTELGWERVGVDTARSHVESVAGFIDNYCENRGLESPNPVIEVPRSWASTVTELIRRHKSDPLYHLFFTTKRSRARKRRLFMPMESINLALPIKTRNPEKTFDLEDFIKLIEFEENPRDRLIWLSLGAAGLRESEALHLFSSDISLDAESSHAALLLAHPTSGLMTTDNTGPTRQSYLKQQFSLLPRNQLPVFDSHYAGWKGIRFQKHATAGVTWLHPSFGDLAWTSHVDYLRLRSAANAKHHPWYFVNLKHDVVGDPMTLSNLYQLLRAACKRLGLRSPSNPHSLRHMYVDTIVRVLGMPLEQAQIMVRHRNPQSTAIYVNIGKELTRRSLETLGKQPTIPHLEQRF